MEESESLTPWDLLTQFALQYGPLGVFVISALGSSTVVVPVPYTFVIYSLGVTLDPNVLAIAGGLGASIGVMTSYVLGYYGRAAVSKDQQRKMDYFVRILGGHMSTAVFVFAFTPLPDALIFIPLGIARYNLLKVWVPNLIGKITMSYVLAWAGRLTLGFVLVLFGEEAGWLSFILVTVLLTLLLVVVLKLDWEKVFEKYFLGRLSRNESNS
jgi:membrane protein DedA with SNARE-associated domain